MSFFKSIESKRISARHYAGLLLISLATLLLELSLTRVLSVSLWYHFGFLVISTALLGLGVSGVILSLWTGLREPLRPMPSPIKGCCHLPVIRPAPRARFNWPAGLRFEGSQRR